VTQQSGCQMSRDWAGPTMRETHTCFVFLRGMAIIDGAEGSNECHRAKDKDQPAIVRRDIGI